MLVSDFIKAVLVRLGDERQVTFKNEEIISCLNDAITQVSLDRINKKDPQMIEELSITPGTTAVPQGFISFVGQEPFFVSGDIFASSIGETALATARFFATKPHVESEADTVPFDETTTRGLLLDYVVVLAGARVGYVSQVEATLAQMLSGSYMGRPGGGVPVAVKE